MEDPRNDPPVFDPLEGSNLGGRGGSPPCLSSLIWDKCEKPKADFIQAVSSSKWLKARDKMEMCRHPDSLEWVGGRDRLGELAPWVRPSECGYRWEEKCATETVTAALEDLEAERKVEHERALGIFLLTFRNCGHDLCCQMAWLHALWCARQFRDKLRYFYGVTAIRAVTVIEPHVTEWPHIHMVARLLPKKTRLIQVHRKGKDVLREVAGRSETKRIRRLWYHISGGWKCDFEVVQSRVQYVAKYLTDLFRLPEELKAFLHAHKTRMYSKSNDLGKRLEPDSRWVVTRGKRRDVERRVLLPVYPNPVILDNPPPLWETSDEEDSCSP